MTGASGVAIPPVGLSSVFLLLGRMNTTQPSPAQINIASAMIAYTALFLRRLRFAIVPP
jgi:hypothetical protein